VLVTQLQKIKETMHNPWLCIYWKQYLLGKDQRKRKQFQCWIVFSNLGYHMIQKRQYGNQYFFSNKRMHPKSKNLTSLKYVCLFTFLVLVLLLLMALDVNGAFQCCYRSLWSCISQFRNLSHCYFCPPWYWLCMH
jgi:hypothetical protein